MHLPEVSGLAVDHSGHCVQDLARFVLLDVDLKGKEHCYYVVDRRGEMSDGPANWRHVIEL